MTRVLVCGGRDYDDEDMIFTTLDDVHVQNRISTIIEGGAPGADRIARKWAHSRHIEVVTFAVTIEEWTMTGRSAGPIRNTRMLKDGKPDLVVAFPGGKGTANMVRQARAAKVMVIEPLRDVETAR